MLDLYISYNMKGETWHEDEFMNVLELEERLTELKAKGATDIVVVE